MSTGNLSLAIHWPFVPLFMHTELIPLFSTYTGLWWQVPFLACLCLLSCLTGSIAEGFCLSFNLSSFFFFFLFFFFLCLFRSLDELDELLEADLKWKVKWLLVVLIDWLIGDMQSVPITTEVVSSNPARGKVYWIQHYVIKFISDLRQVCRFLQVLRFPPPIKLIATI